jgi:hypothetical protein
VVVPQRTGDGRLVCPVTVELQAPDDGPIDVRGGAVLAFNSHGRVFYSQKFDPKQFRQWSDHDAHLGAGQAVVFGQRFTFASTADPLRLALVFDLVGASGQARRQVQWYALAPGAEAPPATDAGQPRFEVHTRPDVPQGALLPRSKQTVWGFDLWLQETNGVSVKVTSYQWQARDADGHVLAEAHEQVTGTGGRPLVCGPDNTLDLAGQRLSLPPPAAATELALVVEGEAAGRRVTALGRAVLAPPRPDAGRALLRLPFKGPWRCAAGPGDPPNLGSLTLGWVFEAVDRAGKNHLGAGLRAADYYSFGRQVLAPAEGRVLATVCVTADSETADGSPRNGASDDNFIIIEHSSTERSYLGGLAKDGTLVTVGMKVIAGQPVAKIGNSGDFGRPALVYRLLQVDPQNTELWAIGPRFMEFAWLDKGHLARTSDWPEVGDLVYGP